MSDKSRRIKLHKCFNKAQRGLAVSLESLETNLYSVKPDLNVKRKRRIFNLMQAKVAQLKLREFRNKIHPEYPKVAQKGTTRRDMWTHADQLPTTPIDKYTVRDILKRVGMAQQQKLFKRVVAEVVEEFSADFVRVTHEAGVRFRVRPFEEAQTLTALEPYKRNGRTENYAAFLRNRAHLQRNLFLHHPLNKKILKLSCDLPQLLVDFGEYRARAYELHSLRYNFAQSFGKRLQLLRNFHACINDSNFKRPKDCTKFFRSANTLLANIITAILLNTIEHLLATINSDERIPYMQLHLFYKGGFELAPSAEDVYELYEEMAWRIGECAGEFRALGGLEQPLGVYIQRDFMDACCAKICSTIYTKYREIDVHIKLLEAGFVELRGRSVVDYQKDLTFQGGMEEVRFYKQLIAKAEAIYLNETYSIGVLDQGYCKSNLKKVMVNYVRVIGAKLGRQHEWESEDICATFRALAARAEENPKTSRALIEKGVYMATASAEILENLDARINAMIAQIPRLMEVTCLSSQHMRANADSINWAGRIKPIIETNAKLYENYKFDFEERLVNEVAQLNDDIAEIVPFLNMLNAMNDAKRAKSYAHRMSNLLVKIRNCETKKEWINDEEKIFKYPISQFTDLEEVKTWIYTFYHLLKLCINWNRCSSAWLDGPFEFLTPAHSERTVTAYERELNAMQKNYRNQLKQMAADNNPRRFAGSVDDPDPLNQPAPLQLCRQVLDSIERFKPTLKIMSIVCNPALLQRHWDEMSEIAGFDMTPNAGTTLRKIIAMDLSSNMEGYEIISAGAVKEQQLITNLKRMIAEWDAINFKVDHYKDTQLKVLIALEDIQVILDDHTIKTLTMRGSVFVKPYEKQVEEWYEVITCIGGSIEAWNYVQSKWLKLVPIFRCEDIAHQIPDETRLFAEIDRVYKTHMSAIEANPNVLETCRGQLYNSLAVCIADLERVGEGVVRYMERKRLYFPRFFFLTNEEMLAVLSETKNPVKVAPNLTNCFDSVHKIHFNAQLEITGINSHLNEALLFAKAVGTKEAGGSVEKWLRALEARISETLREIIKNAKRKYLTSDFAAWVLGYAQQVVVVVVYIHFTANVHAVLRKPARLTAAGVMDNLNRCLANIQSVLRSERALKPVDKLTLQCVVLICVEYINLLAVLLQRNANECDFAWLCALKYYSETTTTRIQLLNASVSYGNEYLGNYAKLALTPTTERCFITLITTQYAHLNASLVGPASSGKTETVKDLARALGTRCVVYNCARGVNHAVLRNFLKGAAASETWLCLDHFNNVEIEVTSVLSQQIRLLSEGMKRQCGSMNFDGVELNLSANTFICLTVNGGSFSKLPDNLAVSFRTVALIQPDFTVIAQLTLTSCGFTKSTELGAKIRAVYNLCELQLSTQAHYDFSLRSIKTALNICATRDFNTDETTTVIHALNNTITPTLIPPDTTLFNLIMLDVFGTTIPPVQPPARDLSEVLRARNLFHGENFAHKVALLEELVRYKHGIILVGEAFTGKSSVVKVLADAIDRGGAEKVEYKFVNPRCVTVEQFYGEINAKTKEWMDGIFTQIFRSFTTNKENSYKWIILDGPIDYYLAENINSVLDDNRKLCLTSGEIISFSERMTILFEVDDLSEASPSTISRCGIIYFNPNTLHWKNVTDAWKQKQSSNWYNANSSMISAYLDWMVEPCLNFVRMHCMLICDVGGHNLVRTFCDMMETIMTDACNERKEEDAKYIVPWMQATVITAGVWGFGGNLQKDSRRKFDAFYRSLWRNENDHHKYPTGIPKLEMLLPPTDGLLLDYHYQYKSKGSWKFWQETVRNQRVEESDDQAENVLIPTVETAKYGGILTKHIQHNKQVMLVGSSGTGKSFLVKDVLVRKLDARVYEPSVLCLTVDTKANRTNELVLSKLHKKKRGFYGPPPNKTAILFVDDLNTLVGGSKNPPACELLRYLFEHETLYDLSEMQEIKASGLLFVSAMRSTRDCSKRFLRHFNVFNIDDFADDSLAKIFNNSLHLAYKNNGFQNEANNAIPPLVAATLDIYRIALEKLLPTPNKSHYVFNIRDFARVVFGCALIRKESTEDKRVFAKVWIHEILRVFYDRLNAHDDREFLFWNVKRAAEEHFKETVEQIHEELLQDGEGAIGVDDLVYFADFSNGYEEVTKEKMHEIATGSLKEYNEQNPINLDLVCFEWSLKHLARICRILRSSSGLLIGTHGLGKQSLTKLATHITKYSFHQPEITHGYALKHWREDLREVLKESGGRGKHSTFLVSDQQILDPIFLQDIDSLLNVGEVPNMFAMNEKQQILEMVRLDAQGGNRNLDITATTVFTYFVNRCKQKLHIIFCLSPTNPHYRKWLRVYTSLLNNCVIDYFEEWPDVSLQAVASEWISNIELDQTITLKALRVFGDIHAQAKLISEEFYLATSMRTHVTTATYMEFVKSFRYLYKSKRAQILGNKGRYMAGLEKLQTAENAVASMQRDLAEFQPQLLEMTNRAAEMTRQIAKETIEVEKASAIVREDEKLANIQAANSQYLKRECEADLADAIPILEDAIEALNTLKPSDITLVKSMKNPPEAVKLVMAGVCVMRDIKPDRINDASTGGKILDYWGPSKRLLGDMNFLQHLKDFDKDHIKLDVMVKIRREYLPNKLFKPHIVAKASSAAEGLCKWIIAMDMYDAVAKEVAPKKEALELAEREYQTTAAFLMEKKQQLAKLEEKLADLNEALGEAKAKQRVLQDNVDACAKKLLRAEKLLTSLSGEKIKWIKSNDSLQSLLDELPGNILISSAFIAYLSPYTYEFRVKYASKFHACVNENAIPCSEAYEFCAVLGEDVKVQLWKAHALPNNIFSLQNAIIHDVSSRWSLLLDPENQGNIWLKQLEQHNGLLVTKFTENYVEVLEVGLKQGKPVLIENIFEDFAPAIEPLLGKYKKRVRFAKQLLTPHENFRLYLTTKLRKPRYSPHITNKLTLINFGIMLAGLKDQLLDIVVAKERPELQKQREDLIKKTAQNRAALVANEENILKTLSESQGDILEDARAVEALDTSKILSLQIINEQITLRAQGEAIEERRRVYTKVSAQSAILYASITHLSNVDPMYQFGLAWFVNLYVRSIETANRSKVLERRLRYLEEAFLYNLYCTVCAALFERDKLVFAFLLCCNIQMANGVITQREFNTLLCETTKREEVKPYAWLSDEQWNGINALDIEGLVEDFSAREEVWKGYCNNAHLPVEWLDKLSGFQVLLLTRIFHKQRFYKNATEYIAAGIGVKFTKPPAFDLASSFEASTCICPLVFILSPGDDPMEALQAFSAQKRMSNLLHTVSMGQEQQTNAENMLKNARETGAWICLQNCHVDTTWLPHLERLVENINLSDTHTGFRLWITTRSTRAFPISILQTSVKITKQTPRALKEALLEAYTTPPLDNAAFFTACSAKEDQFAKMLYGLTYFHHVIRNRLPMYAFEKPDYTTSCNQLQALVADFNGAVFEAVPYLIARCNYGGNCTDAWHLRLLQTLFAACVNSEMRFKFNAHALPKRFSYEDYLDHIRTLPHATDSEIYSVHANVTYLQDVKTSDYLAETLMVIHGAVSPEHNRDEQALLQVICDGLSEKIPPETELQSVDTCGEFGAFHAQEIALYRTLLSTVTHSLTALKNALAGRIQLDDALEATAESLLKSAVPQTWQRVAYPHRKNLPRFIHDLTQRLSFIKTAFSTQIVWISSFYNPAGFLATIKRNHARNSNAQFEEIALDFIITDELPEIDEGFLIRGLFLVGASWDRAGRKLRELEDNVFYDEMPVILVKPVLLSELDNAGKYECPVFITPERTGSIGVSGLNDNFVATVWLDTDQCVDHWINRNVALLCQIE